MQAFTPGIEFTQCAQPLSANVAWKAHVLNRACRIHREVAISWEQTLSEQSARCPSRWFCRHLRFPSISVFLHIEIRLLFHGVTYDTLLSHSLILVFFLPLPPCFPPPHGCTRMTLISPSGPHWGLPLSSADNYCHLHIAQCDKHLLLRPPQSWWEREVVGNRGREGKSDGLKSTAKGLMWECAFSQISNMTRWKESTCIRVCWT